MNQYHTKPADVTRHISSPAN